MEDSVMDMKETAKEAYAILSSQNQLLDSMIDQQKKIRAAVTRKDWSNLEELLYKVNELTDTFTEQEAARDGLCKSVCAAAHITATPDMYRTVCCFPAEFRTPIMEMFHQVRRKLTASKIENDALNDYIRITKGFLQGVFDSVIPKNRNTVYSRTGTVVKPPVPESLVLNTVL